MIKFIFYPPHDSGGEQVYPGIPSELVCGMTYKFTIRVNKHVSGCNGINYRDIYQRAKAAATDRINMLHCLRLLG